jgi:hypothetical protein
VQVHIDSAELIFVFVEQYTQGKARNASGMMRATKMFVVSPLGVGLPNAQGRDYEHGVSDSYKPFILLESTR